MDFKQSFISLLPLLIVYWYLFFTEFRSSRGSNQISALVLARGGSKGIKLKNLSKLGNQTLIGRTLNALKRVKQLSSVWVSTDSYDIATEAHLNNARIHVRQKYTATDKASSLIAVQEFLHYNQQIQIVALVQCTSPFLSEKYIEEAIRLIELGYDSVFSVTRQFKLRWTYNQGNLVADNFNPNSRPRRQDWSGELVENGMFYITSREMLLKWNTFQGGRKGIVEVPQEYSLEIDTPADLHIAELILKTQNKN